MASRRIRCSGWGFGLGLAHCAVLALAFLCVPAGAWAQTQSQQPLPDAPSAKRTPQQLPAQPPINTAPLPPLSGNDDAPSSSRDGQVPPSADDAVRPKFSPDENPFPEPGTPGNPSTSVPDAAAPSAIPTSTYKPPKPPSADQEQLFTISKNVNFVSVPVTVKDSNGLPVTGLTFKDFMLLEGGVRQDLKFFTSDPSAISAAVVFDQGMPDVAVQKLNETLSALEGAFSIYDEVAIYTYSSAVRKLKDFGALGKGSAAAFSLLRSESGRNSTPQVMSGPLASGPTVNGIPIGGGPTLISTPRQETHALNDAILRAASDLGRRERGRKRVIFIVSDGRESGSEASYADVLRVLLTNEITVYAVAVDDAALPVIRKLKQIKLPQHGYGNILPKYTSATGGENFPEFSKAAMEKAYSMAMGDARNRYTLGFYTKAQPGVFRELEVRVSHPGLKVTAKDGFYLLPPARRAATAQP